MGPGLVARRRGACAQWQFVVPRVRVPRFGGRYLVNDKLVGGINCRSGELARGRLRWFVCGLLGRVFVCRWGCVKLS